MCADMNPSTSSVATFLSALDTLAVSTTATTLMHQLDGTASPLSSTPSPPPASPPQPRAPHHALHQHHAPQPPAPVLGSSPVPCAPSGGGAVAGRARKAARKTHPKRGRRTSLNSTLRCLVCHQYYSRKDNLRAHMRVHTGERPYRCVVCTHSFRWLGALRTHEAAVHMHHEHLDLDQDQHTSPSPSPATTSPPSPSSPLSMSMSPSPCSAAAAAQSPKHVQYVDETLHHSVHVTPGVMAAPAEWDKPEAIWPDAMFTEPFLLNDFHADWQLPTPSV